jgi:hypothetical protein
MSCRRHGDFVILHHPQQLDLQDLTHLTDFVEKQRAPVRGLKKADFVSYRAGKGPLLISEHFRLQQAIRQRSAIHRNERLVPTRPIRMDCPRNQLLAGPAFPLQEHRALALGHPSHQLIHSSMADCFPPAEIIHLYSSTFTKVGIFPTRRQDRDSLDHQLDILFS